MSVTALSKLHSIPLATFGVGGGNRGKTDFPQALADKNLDSAISHAIPENDETSAYVPVCCSECVKTRFGAHTPTFVPGVDC
jgi:hypothetical protein